MNGSVVRRVGVALAIVCGLWAGSVQHETPVKAQEPNQCDHAFMKPRVIEITGEAYPGPESGFDLNDDVISLYETEAADLSHKYLRYGVIESSWSDVGRFQPDDMVKGLAIWEIPQSCSLYDVVKIAAEIAMARSDYESYGNQVYFDPYWPFHIRIVEPRKDLIPVPPADYPSGFTISACYFSGTEYVGPRTLVGYPKEYSRVQVPDGRVEYNRSFGHIIDFEGFDPKERWSTGAKVSYGMWCNDYGVAGNWFQDWRRGLRPVQGELVRMRLHVFPINFKR